MRVSRFRLRTLMIAIAVLAPVFAIGVLLLKLGLYARGGGFELDHRIGDEIAAGDEQFSVGNFVGAEMRFRSVLKLQVERDALPSIGRRNAAMDAWISIGLADALAGQGRAAEADLWYRKCIAIAEAEFEPESYMMRYAKFLRGLGRVSEAEACEARARTIREGAGP